MNRRESFRVEVEIRSAEPAGATKVYLTFDEAPRGHLVGLWVDLHIADASAAERAWANQWAILASKLLQLGYPVAALAESLRHTRFPPDGAARIDGRTRFVTSILDCVGLELEARYGETGVTGAATSAGRW